MINLEKYYFFNASSKARWGIIICSFFLIAALDFGTPPEYILAYLYVIPILISISFLKINIAKNLLILAIAATFLNLIFPRVVLNIPSVVVNRSLSAFAILISAFFMVKYIRYQQRLQAQDTLLSMQQNLSKVREDFIATLTHDLKTPLLGEEQALKHMLQGALGPLTPEQKELVEVLQRGNQRQLDLVQTLVAAYKNDNFGVQLQLAEADVDEMIADLLIEVQHLASERNIVLEYTCLRTPPPIKADILQLKRVIANLLHNALNYTPSGGKISLTLTEHPEHILVEVADTGPGIQSGDLEHVFERFYQSGDNRQVMGTGLGLYLSRQIISAHRGSIWAENLMPAGCKFSFTLPLEAMPVGVASR